MNAKRKKMYTGKVELHNGWEIRPYAYLTKEGTFVPQLSARKHLPGSAIAVVTLDMICFCKDDAFSQALKEGLRMVTSA